MNRVQLTVTTATMANKAREILSSAGIVGEVKKARGGTAVGCLFGVFVPKSALPKALQLLKQADIKVISVKEVTK